MKIDDLEQINNLRSYEEDDDSVAIIPMERRTAELEREVEYFLSIIPSLPENKIRYKRITIPESFKTNALQDDWEDREIDRCINGHNGMCGKMYFWYNYCYIINIEKGKLAPEFRVADNEWFKHLEWARDSKGWGLVCVKRRRAGFSWKAAADVLHDAMFSPHTFVGMNSKTERDSKILFQKVQFIYDNLPEFLKAKLGSRASMRWEFYDEETSENGKKKKTGTQSQILCVPPTDSAFEGHMLNKWLCDEAGKIPNLPQLWSFTEDCLMQEMKRVGVPILFGTSGEIDKAGAGLLEMWRNSDIYKLKRFFFGAWMGLYVDEYGNDKIEDCVRWIVYERDRRKRLSSKQYNDFLQKYPLTIKEAFSYSAQGGVGDVMKINSHLNSLRDDPAESERGYMKVGKSGEPEFIPDKNGPIIVYERPKPELGRGAYVFGCDPADHDYDGVDVSTEVSKLSTYGMKKREGMLPPIIVCDYTDRPNKAAKFYEQTALLQCWYNNSRVLIEKNRYRMIAWYEENGYKNLLNRTPSTITRLFGKGSSIIGVHMTTGIKEYMEDSISDYIDDYCEYIPSEKLLEECLVFGAQNTDRVYAFGMCLMQMVEEKKREVSGNAYKSRLPSFRFRKDRFGRIIRSNVDTKYNKL